MIESLFAKDPALLIPIIMAICGGLVGIVAIIAYHWHNVRQVEVEAALKQDMLNRGMTADEIERVVKASNKSANSKPSWAHNKKDPISDNEYYLVERLVDEGKSAEEIERIIKAVKAGGQSAPMQPIERV
jgi:hypothetical protein